jgi:hypothetical protein
MSDGTLSLKGWTVNCDSEISLYSNDEEQSIVATYDNKVIFSVNDHTYLGPNSYDINTVDSCCFLKIDNDKKIINVRLRK